MAIRRRAVLPDTAVHTETYGPVPAVSDDAFLAAVIAAAQAQALSGGVLTILVDRHPTDLPHEMVTTGAVIEWKDRTDAKAQREAPSPIPAAPPAPPAPAPEEDAYKRSGAEAADETATPTAPAAELEPDGLDRAALEEEDVSSLPEAMR